MKIREDVHLLLQWTAIRSDEGLMLETSASESRYGGQFTLSTQLIKPNYLARNFILHLKENDFRVRVSGSGQETKSPRRDN